MQASSQNCVGLSRIGPENDELLNNKQPNLPQHTLSSGISTEFPFIIRTHLYYCRMTAADVRKHVMTGSLMMLHPASFDMTLPDGATTQTVRQLRAIYTTIRISLTFIALRDGGGM